MGLQRQGSIIGLAGVLAAALIAGPASGQGFGFEVVVNLTAKAAQALKLDREGVVVSAWYYADPKPGDVTNVNPVGLIDLGTEEHVLESMAGGVAIDGAGVDLVALGHIGGPVMVNVNVFSARRAGPDNVLDCDFFDGLLSRAAAAPVELRCGLFDERLTTQAKS